MTRGMMGPKDRREVAAPAVGSGYDVAPGRELVGKDGQSRAITTRTSYGIAPSGEVLYLHGDSSPAGHVHNTLDAVRRYRAAQHWPHWSSIIRNWPVNLRSENAALVIPGHRY